MERKWWTLLAGCTAIFMLLLDVTIVNVALPSIERGLHATFSDLQWVIDAYALTLAGVLLAAGSLADKVGRRASDPLLDLGLFRKPAFTGATIAGFALSASIFSMFLYITLFFQNVLGYSPFEAGLRSLPVTGPILFVSPLSGRLTARVPVRLLLGTGLAFVAVGLLLMGNLSDSSGWTALLPGQVLAGIGIGLATPGLASTAVGVVRPQLSGMASGANNTARQLGLATGIAGLGSIFQV